MSLPIAARAGSLVVVSKNHPARRHSMDASITTDPLAGHVEQVVRAAGLTFEDALDAARTGGETPAAQALHAGYTTGAEVTR